MVGSRKLNFSKEPKVEECDATVVDSSTKVGNIINKNFPKGKFEIKCQS